MKEALDRTDSPKRLDNWQTYTHPGLVDCTPSVLFETDFLERYHRLHSDLWQRVIRVHGTLYTLEQLREFPFDYIYAPNGMEFWRLVVGNFLDMTCLLLHGLVADTGKDVLSLQSFKSAIMQARWLDNDKLALLKETLRERKFDRDVKSIAGRVGTIRDHRIAHRIVDQDTGLFDDQVGGVALEELRQLFDATHAMFGALSFPSTFVTLSGDLIPTTVRGKPTRTCLDGVLDAVSRDSYFVNEPERRGQWWPMDRRNMDAKVLQSMNDLRRRVGLPEV